MVCVRFVTVYACALCLNKKFQVNVLIALSDCQLSVTSATVLGNGTTCPPPPPCPSCPSSTSTPAVSTGLGNGTCTVIPDQEPGNLEIHQYLQRIKNIPRQVY